MGVLSNIDDTINNSDGYFVCKQIFEVVAAAANNNAARFDRIIHNITVYELIYKYNLVTINDFKALLKSSYIKCLNENLIISHCETVSSPVSGAVSVLSSTDAVLNYLENDIVEFYTPLLFGLLDITNADAIDKMQSTFGCYHYRCSIKEIRNMKLKSIVARDILSANIIFSQSFFDNIDKFTYSYTYNVI